MSEAAGGRKASDFGGKRAESGGGTQALSQFHHLTKSFRLLVRLNDYILYLA